ncbi:hypothetical protein FEF65_08810 [Mariprofundus erugo]|uniref:Adenylosuccinate synthetase n=1 Tax=Mariprofundus erugo TaxID=2528639 RepID=A0A5R9GN12_9PROT|nr:adenylosuccinate synthetase [Mariprofundus erugo]TLS67038.1 hypothetical protein FEF65_08810 [Mariprofundus erugo]
MPVTVVIGGQFGSEGKGKVSHFFAREQNATIAIRVGGTNSGHTVIDENGRPVILRQLPTASLLPDVVAVLPAGAYIDPVILKDEMELLGISPDRVVIDPNAMVISSEDIDSEKCGDLRSTIGSTASGTGAAVQRRISRNKDVILAKDHPELMQLTKPTVPLLRSALDKGERVIIEGTQGYGLSLIHSPFYPFVTSRDTSAAAFIAEAGISPFDVDDVILVLRSFPIRVAGNSGPLNREVDWQEVSRSAGTDVLELSSVTRMKRRVAEFDSEIVKQAIAANRPTKIVLNHIDYIDNGKASQLALGFVEGVEKEIGCLIDFLGFGQDSLISHSAISNDFVSEQRCC